MLVRYGETRSLDDAERLLNEIWRPELARKEAALFATKNFDARDLHPLIATDWFAWIFTDEVRKLIRKHIDPRPPKVDGEGRVISDWNPIKAGDFMTAPMAPNAKRLEAWKRKLNSLIRARQHADLIGAPYDVYLREAVRRIYFGRLYLLEFTGLAQPQHLVGEEMQGHLIIKWGETVEARVQVAQHQRYRLANRCVHPDILDHQDWLCQQVARRQHKRYVIKSLLEQDVLSAEIAHQRFPSLL